MSELVTSAAGVSALESESASAGNLLRRAREAAGLHIGALAVSLKVPVRKLEALEADEFDSLPDMVFVRALASSVCRTLRIDPAPVLAKLPAAQTTPAPREYTLNAPLSSAAFTPTGVARSTSLSRPMVLAVVALLLGALGLFVWPQVQSLNLKLNLEQWLGVGDENPPATAPTVAQPDASRSAPPVAPGAPASQATNLPPVAVASPGVALVATPALAVASGLVVFSVKSDTWVEVTDARGATSLRRLIPAGQTAGASGNVPLAVTVGRADTTQVTVRGQPFDLAPVSRDNVARFQVK